MKTAMLEKGLAGSEFLAGNRVTLADLFLVPTLDYLSQTPESEVLLSDTKNINSWLLRMMAMDSTKTVLLA